MFLMSFSSLLRAVTRIFPLVVAGVVLGYLALPASSAAQSLYEDPRANQVGDVVTVILAEETSAQRESGYQGQSSAQFGGSGGASQLENTFGVDAEFSSGSNSSNESMQNELLQGRLTAEVVDVNDTGNLIIEGERRVNINGVTHIMHVTGTVRDLDVRGDNTLFSYEIANADIEYRRAGVSRRFFRPGILARVGAVAALGAAIFFGTQ